MAMKKRTKYQQIALDRLTGQKWQITEELPEAGVITLYRWGAYCSIKKDGVVYPGNLCEKFGR